VGKEEEEEGKTSFTLSPQRRRRHPLTVKEGEKKKNKKEKDLFFVVSSLLLLFSFLRVFTGEKEGKKKKNVWRAFPLLRFSIARATSRSQYSGRGKKKKGKEANVILARQAFYLHSAITERTGLERKGGRGGKKRGEGKKKSSCAIG